MTLPYLKMSLPQKMWQGHYVVWQGHFKVWQRHLRVWQWHFLSHEQTSKLMSLPHFQMTLPHKFMSLPLKRWRGHVIGWQGHFLGWQGHYFWFLLRPSPENCHGIKNDLTHQKNVFATPKYDLATQKVARSFFCVARSYKSVAMTLFLCFVHTFARILSWDKKCLCHTTKWPCHPK